MKETHSLPALPRGVKPGDAVTVRVRPGHNYGLENPAGTVLKVSAADWQQGHRALELVVEGEDPTPQTPRSQLISMPSAMARGLGLPVGPGEVVATFEATPWPAEAAALGMQRREELERTALHLAGGKSIEEVEAFAAAFGWEEEDGDPMVWIKTTLPRIKTNYGEAQERAVRVAEAQERASLLCGELAAVRQELAEVREASGKQVAEVLQVRQALAVAEENVARERQAATTLSAELTAAKAEIEALKAAAPTAAPAAPKGKKE